jgi:small-conductance mechanosensitive channel/CRP-like cAMP-binding protein
LQPASRASEWFSASWAFLPIGGALIAIAFLINVYLPMKRRRIRRAVIVYALYLAVLAAHLVLHLFGWKAWADGVGLAAAVLEGFSIVSLFALAIFDLALPALRIEVVTIASDLLVGLAYVATALGTLHGRVLDLSSVIATSAVIGGVLTISLQSTLGNVIGGVALQLDGSVHVGDWLQMPDGQQGIVREIRWRHTVLETRNWDTIIVPNATLLAQNIMIRGKRAGSPHQQRMWVYFDVDFRFPPQHVIAVVEEALQSAPIQGVATDPKPNCICYDFAKDGRDSFGYYAVRYWLTDFPNDDPTNSRIRTRIYAALKRADIPLARPSSTVFFTPDDDPREREARHRERRRAALKGLELFKPLTPDELETLVDHLSFAPFAAGEVVTHQGAVAHWLYVLTSGKVDVVLNMPDGTKKTIAKLAAPGFFGEMGLMTGEARANDVIATTQVQCYRLDKEGFTHIIQQRPEIAKAMSQTLAERRVELEAARDGLDEEAKSVRQISEQRRILARMQEFFGLEK